jgi:hypothetical protein
MLSDEDLEIKGGMVQSPMSLEQMRAAADEEILNLFAELTDGKSRKPFSLIGGSPEASRVFGEFAKVEPGRAQGIIDKFLPGLQERPAADGIGGLASGKMIEHARLLELIIKLDTRGFHSPEYRQQISWVLSNLAADAGGFDDVLCALIESWLQDEASVHESEPAPRAQKSHSFLANQRGMRTLPQGNYPILRALFAGLCTQKQPAADKWLSALERHLEGRRESCEVWSALLFHEMRWLLNADRQRARQLVEKLFRKYPQLLEDDAGPLFIAANQSWLDAEFIHSCLRAWEYGSWGEGPQAAAEVCMYRYALAPDDLNCERTIERILTGQSIDPSILPSMRLGMAFSFGELWNHPTTRNRTNPILIRFMPLAEGRSAEALVDIFRVCDSLPADHSTCDVLDALVACPTPLREAGGGFLVDRLKDLIADGNEPERVYSVASAIIRTPREPGVFHHRLSHAADGLVEIALTLQRFAETRSNGVELFEDLMDLEVHSVSTTLSELDRRIPSVRAGS